MKIVAISAGLSDASAATQLARAIAEEALMGTASQVGAAHPPAALGNSSTRVGLGDTPIAARPEVISLRAYARDIADAMTLGFPSEKLEALFAKVARADAVVAVAPVYNAMPSGLFISFFNVLPEQTLAGKPVALGATGGTPRHSLVIEQAMRPMFIYLHALVPTTAVYAATEDWGAPGEGFDGAAGKGIAKRVEREGRELRALVLLATGDPRLVAEERDAARNDDGEAVWTVTAPVAESGGHLTEPGQSSHPGQGAATDAGLAANRAGFKYGAKSADEAAAIEQFPDFVSFEDLLK
ncbi:MAG: NAD(P)H-dependent oxidoreductase [Ancrocorticia sp.]